MNNRRRFWYVYRLIEEIYGRNPTTIPEIEIERAFKRYLRVTGEKEVISTPK